MSVRQQHLALQRPIFGKLVSPFHHVLFPETSPVLTSQAGMCTALCPMRRHPGTPYATRRAATQTLVPTFAQVQSPSDSILVQMVDTCGQALRCHHQNHPSLQNH
eukprot:2823867-Amphidinium_carterae.1